MLKLDEKSVGKNIMDTVKVMNRIKSCSAVE